MAEFRHDTGTCSFTPYIVALGDCLVQLRLVLRAELEQAALPTDVLPALVAVSPDSRARISSILETVRRAQFLVGRPCDDAPDWLDVIIEGE